MTTFKYLLLAALAAPTAMVAAAPAHAQINGIATADPIAAMYRSKAWTTASQQIRQTYAAQFTALQAKGAERDKLLNQTVLAQLDKNGDKQVDDTELASNPALKAQLDKIDEEMNQLMLPIILAQGFAIDRILERYAEAQRNVVTAKKIGIMVSPQAIIFATDAADVTAAITAELDRLVPTVSIQPVPNRRPSEEAMSLLQQFLRIDQILAQRQAAAPAAAAPAGARPAAAPPAAGTRPATQPAKPTTPPPGR
ncbi:MAG TPA: OmpH family outer membrane protein [Sphingomonas sp.]|nr:OmpH family outer membrane protein [Sphingomonas sp.]